MSQPLKPRGSILIWTMLLGISLATVFFFFSQQLGASAANQRETIEYQNARLFFESYIAYLQSLPVGDLAALRDANGGKISFQGISGTLTNETETITGILDAGAEDSFSARLPAAGTDRVKIEWDLCPKDDTEMLVIVPAAPASVSDNCGSGLTHEKMTEISSTSFTLSAPAGPVHYRLSGIGGAILYDNKWRLNLEYSIGFRKKLNTSLSFRPGF